MTRLGAAGSAVAPFPSTGTPSPTFVPGPVVVSVRKRPGAPVYNLTVAEAHEYFANDILVSNCDAALYAYRYAYHYLAAPQEPIVQYGTREWYEKQEEKMLEEAEEEYERQQRGEWWEDYPQGS